jgi:carbonic anhydrase
MILALAGAWACHQEMRHTAQPTEEDKHAHAPHAHWGYDAQDEAGPAHWAELVPDAHACKDGHQQSPIDLDASVAHGSKELQFHYQATKLDVVNNGHTL